MPLLQISGLTQYFGGLCALSDFSITLEGRELIALIGPNGAGKTTVFNLISGFYTPTAGDIVFQGERINGLRPHAITLRGIARTFQNIRLWHDMTVLENIQLAQHGALQYGLWDAFARTSHYRSREAAISAWSMEILEALKLRDLAGERPRNLPYGVQRRVEIARALSTRPSLLLLDEPAAGLNSADVRELIDLIGWIHREFPIAIWMIEHQMDVVMTLCSWIKVIDFGVTIAEGTPQQIQTNPDVIKAYLGDENI
ncbi:ABC transporter ATP-binding protein [Thermodesulfomicrobium sp. WS]|uniref:ABC transporter ATP-binding protein n=1 Tax=Thermodesulfomicrobium sp. WS TaxID=3004129 RepID=UPI0024906D51|nr:ABC transporter ATP-binding protein [Thermodesulfomicrobium sp. WS]BDV00663.1 ABC transporter ATP-binding protein [Thermodesulfomicrobium sp. WS]